MTLDLKHHDSPDKFFFTVRLQNPASDLLTREIDLLRDTIMLCRKRWPFEIDAAVVLPSALHMIWTLPLDDNGYANRWRMIMSTFLRHIPASDRSKQRGGKSIWQRRFCADAIEDRADFQRYMQFIALAPVHAGLVARQNDWPYGSWQSPGLTSLRTTAPVPSNQDPVIAANAS